MKIISFFDYIDYDEDVENIKLLVSNYDKPIEYIPCSNEIEFSSHLSPNCIALIDFGAIGCIGGQSGMFDHYNRWFYKIISNHPSIKFVFILTMGKELYDSELFELENVSTVERCNLYSKGFQILLD